jgi:hypothetical protein
VQGIALGELFVTAENRKELRKLLRANVACDVIDVVSLGVAVACGDMERLRGALHMVGAVVCAALGFVGLKSD